MTKITEMLVDAVEPDMELKHRIGSGIVRLIVGGIFGAIAVAGYKAAFDLDDEDKDLQY